MASLADAEQTLRSTNAKANFQRLTRLLICGGTKLLREKFDCIHKPTDLPKKLSDPATMKQLKGAHLTKDEWKCLYPCTGTYGKSSDFDITLTFRLLRHICSLTPPPSTGPPGSGWDKLPIASDHSLEADLARIKHYRNKVHAHTTIMEIPDDEFGILWNEISEALLRIAASISHVKRDEWRKSIDKLMSDDPLTPEAERFADELQLWYEKDRDVKKEIQSVGEKLEKLCEEFQGLREDVRQSLHIEGIPVCIEISVETMVQSGVVLRFGQLKGRLVIIKQEDNDVQEQAAGVESGLSHDQRIEENRQELPKEEDFWDVAAKYTSIYLKYLKDKFNVILQDIETGSLLVTVECSSLQMLEQLWENYISGHLNEVAEKIFVTDDVLEKLGLTGVKLKTNISEEEYKQGKQILVDKLVCPVCCEQFSEIREPKTLQCRHTFCKACLEAWFKRRQREGELSCPMCRKITECPNNDIDSIPSTFPGKEERASYGHQVKDLTEDQQARSVVVSKIPKVTTKNSRLMQNLVVRHFEWAWNGGGKIEFIQFPNEETAIITFESSEVVKRVMDLPHVLGGTYLKVCRYSAEAFYELSSSKIKVVKRRRSRKAWSEPGSPGKATLMLLSSSDQGHERREKQVQTGVADKLSEARISFKEQEETYLPDELVQLRQMLANEVQLREKKEQELMEMEVIVFEFQKTLEEEQTRIADAQQEERLNSDLVQMLDEKERSIVEMQRTLKEERQARLAVTEEEEIVRNDLDQMRKTLHGRERTVVELQKAVVDEQQAKTAVSEELSQARTALSELEEIVAEERLQKTTLEERLRGLEDRMEEERNSYLFTERELQSAVSEAGHRLQEENRQKTALEERIRSLEHEKEEELAESRDWIIPREEVVLGERILGKGVWGEVREGTFRGCQVAVKNVHELIISDYNRRRFEQEISIASRCRHPNILQLIGATNEKGSSPLLITELLDTSLRQVLHDRALKQSEIFGLSLDVAKGLNYLHLHKPHPIIHRNITSANVLLWRRDDCWRAKLSDYGSVNFFRQSQTENLGSPIYSAPESSETSQHSPKMDVYSFGVLLCEMCTREQPDHLQLHKQIGRVNGDLRKLIQRCVKERPQLRPDINEVLCKLEELCKS